MDLDLSTPAERLLVDPRLGLLTAVTRQPPQPGLPDAWVGYGAHVADTTAYAPWVVDRYGFGAALGDPDRARRAAIGEAVERYCGNIVPDNLPIASYADLVAAGHRAIDPTDLALYSPTQYAATGFPFVPFTRDLPVAWVPGTCLHTGAEVMVPASLAYLNFFTGPRRGHPPTNALSYAGIAAGTDRAHAERFALEDALRTRRHHTVVDRRRLRSRDQRRATGWLKPPTIRTPRRRRSGCGTSHPVSTCPWSPRSSRTTPPGWSPSAAPAAPTRTRPPSRPSSRPSGCTGSR